MMENAKPADGVSGHRIIIADWKPHEKNTLRGFFTATLPSGIVYHDLMLHQKNDARWIGFPAKEWTDPQGKKQYSRFVDFVDRATADRFRDAVLDALDQHLAGGAQ